MFRIGVRSLAAFRIALVVLLLADMIRRAPLAGVFLTTDGVLPASQFSGPLVWLTSVPGELIGAGVAGLAMVALLVGYRSQLSALVCLVALTAVQLINPWILDSGDVVLRLLLLWAVLLPVGAVWSLDARWSPAPKDEYVLSFATVGVLLVIPSVYLLSVVQKLTGTAWLGGTAVADALAGSLWPTALGHWVSGQPGLATAMTYSVLIIEVVAPILLLSPWRTRGSRLLGITLLVALQVGIGSVLRMGLFPWVMTAGLIPFLPVSTSGGTASQARERQTPRWLQTAGALALLLMVVWNVRGPRWTMYSPDPYASDFGIEIQLELTSGERVTLDSGRGRERFEPVDRLWSDYRGGIYMESLTDPDAVNMRRGFANWVRHTWEATDGAGRIVRRVELRFLEWPPDRPDDVRSTPLPLEDGVVS